MTATPRSRPLLLFSSPEHDCAYLPDRLAKTQFADPRTRMDMSIYAQLAALGFRRSGDHVYRPACTTCQACIPVRLPVREFVPNRSQRRTQIRNRDLEVIGRPPEFDPEHYRLYRQYTHGRHPGGGMDDSSPETYLEFLSAPWSETTFHEFRLDRRLVAVAVIDRFPDGLSAVYTFFDTELSRGRALGIAAILWQIEHARALGLSWLYLGYWIRQCAKMSYKDRFRPMEILQDGEWRRIESRGAVFED